MERTQALGSEPVGKLLRQFSIPAIVGMLVNALYNVVDSIFVGNGVGEVGLTAVTIAFPIMLILMGLGMLIGIGAGSLISIRMGEQKPQAAEKILGNALTMLVITALVFTAGILMGMDFLLSMLGAQGDVLGFARQFTQIIIAGSISMFVGFGLNNIVRAEGNPRIAMITMLLSACINAVLNPLFIFGLGLGIRGSALATVLAQTVSAIWVLAYFLGGWSTLKIHMANLVPERTIITEILQLGMPSFLMQIAASVVSLLYNFSLLTYGGELAVAVYGIVGRVALLTLMPIFGINQGVQPIIGYNYGARQFHRVIEALNKAMLVSTVISVAGFALIQIFDTHIIRVFNSNPTLVDLGGYALRVNLLMLPIIGFQVIGASYFQATGKAGVATFLSMSRQVILLIPMLIFLPRFFGLNGIWSAGPAADFGSALLTGGFLVSEIKKMRQAGTS